MSTSHENYDGQPSESELVSLHRQENKAAASANDPNEKKENENENENGALSLSSASSSTSNFWGMILVTLFLFFYTIGNAIISYFQSATLEYFISRYLMIFVVCVPTLLVSNYKHRRHPPMQVLQTQTQPQTTPTPTPTYTQTETAHLRAIVNNNNNNYNTIIDDPSTEANTNTSTSATTGSSSPPPPYFKHFYGDSKREMCLIWLHGCLECGWVYMYFYALSSVHIGDMEAIYLFTAPPLVALIGRFVFRESFPRLIVVIVIVDAIGVILVTQPSFMFGANASANANNPGANPNSTSSASTQTVSWQGILLCLSSALLYACDVSIVSHAPSLHWLQLVTVTCVQALFIWTPCLLLWSLLSSTPSSSAWSFWADWNWLQLAAVGVVSVVSQLCLIFGYKVGVSTKVVWLEYVNLVFAYTIQWGILNGIGNAYQVVGSALIASTFFVQAAQTCVDYLKGRSY